MPRGRLEGTLTVPAGGWAFSATNGTGGPSVCTVAAGTYSVTAYAAAIAAALIAGRPAGWTVTCSFGESGTGLVTINCSSTPWLITWTTPEIGAHLGHSNIASRSSALAGGVVPGLWMPDCPYWAPYDKGDQGHYETDARQTISPTGAVKTLYGNKRQVLVGMSWGAVDKARVKAFNTGAAFQPFESWWLAVHLGEDYVAFTPGSPVWFYPDADVASATQYKILDLSTFAPPQTVNGWSGRLKVDIPRMMAVP